MNDDASGGGRSPCATCGACCRSYLVPVCGQDVWRIATSQRLDPEAFLFACPQDAPAPDGFRLRHDGPTHGLALDKQGPLRATQPCVFLLRLGGGHDRCGVYADRPVVCRAYPMSAWGERVAQRDDALCPSDAWTAADVSLPAWGVALQRLRMQFDVYHEVVARWNAHVAAEPDVSFALREYLAYLLSVHTRLARLDDELGAAALARVEAEWRRRGGTSWLHYLGRARRIVDDFYPGVAPQPLRLGGAAMA